MSQSRHLDDAHELGHVVRGLHGDGELGRGDVDAALLNERALVRHGAVAVRLEVDLHMAPMHAGREMATFGHSRLDWPWSKTPCPSLP